MDAEGLQDLFRPLGPVQTRRMFSGFGIYHDGLIVAVMMRGELYLKGDETTEQGPVQRLPLVGVAAVDAKDRQENGAASEAFHVERLNLWTISPIGLSPAMTRLPCQG